MIEHLKGRPCSIIRAPDGIDHRNGSSATPCRACPNWSELTTVEGDRKPYLQIDRVEGLIAMAQIAAVEFHPWNCAAGPSRAAGAPRVRSGPRAGRAVRLGRDRSRQGDAGAAGAARAHRLLQDHGRQGPARRHAAEGQGPTADWAGRKPRPSPRPSARTWPTTAPDKLSDQHVEEAAQRAASSSTISATTACRPPSRRCRRGPGRARPSRCR